jgi:hypothetical protein
MEAPSSAPDGRMVTQMMVGRGGIVYLPHKNVDFITSGVQFWLDPAGLELETCTENQILTHTSQN